MKKLYQIADIWFGKGSLSKGGVKWRFREIKGTNDNTLGSLADEISTLSDDFFKKIQDLKKTINDKFFGDSRYEANNMITLAENYSCNVTSKITEIQSILENPIK